VADSQRTDHLRQGCARPTCALGPARHRQDLLARILAKAVNCAHAHRHCPTDLPRLFAIAAGNPPSSNLIRRWTRVHAGSTTPRHSLNPRRPATGRVQYKVYNPY